MMPNAPLHARRSRWEPHPWPRCRRRRWLRPDDLASVSTMFATIPSLPRAELARLTTRMIDRMDEIDGDPDAEFTGEDDEDNHDREWETRHE